MTSRRTVAGFVALAAITGTLVFGGSIAANADLGLEIDTTPTVYSGVVQPLVFGSAASDNLTAVEVSFGTVAEPGGVICGGVIPDGTTGAWSCSSILPPGIYTVTARQTGPVARTDTETISVVPPAPTYGGADPYQITQGGTATFTGTTTAPDAHITVLIPGAGSCSDGPFTGSGTPWSCSVPGVPSLAPGDYVAQVYQTSGAIEGAHLTPVLRVLPAQVVITSPAWGSSIVWTGSPTTISGTTSDPGAIDVWDVGRAGDTLLCPDVVPVGATWSCTPGGAFPAGIRTIRADQSPASFESVFEVLVPRPTVSNDNPTTVPSVGTAVFGGSVTYPTGQVQVVIPDLAMGCSVDIIGPGTWECPIAFAAEGPGTYQVQITHVDGGAPTQSAVTLDLIIGNPAPPGPVIDSPVDGAEVTSGGGDWLTVAGRAPVGEPGFPVDLEVDGFTYCDDLVVDYNAEWTCDIDLGVGTYELVAYQQYPEGGAYSASVTITVVEAAGLVAPTIACAFTPNGGVALSSPQTLEWLDLYSLNNFGGGKSDGDDFGLPGNCNGNSGSSVNPDDTFDYNFSDDCLGGCSLSGLAPGLYEVYYQLNDGVPVSGVSFEPHSYLFTIPEQPAITTAASTVSSVVLSGTATPGDGVRIVSGNGSNLCTTTASDRGAWACQFPKSSASSARALAINPPSGGMSAYSASRSIPVLAVPVTPGAEPPVALVSWFLEFGGDLSNLKPGDKFTLKVSGMPVGTEIEVWMHSDPYLLGTAVGTGLPIEMNLQVPEDIDSGPHEIEMIAITPLGTNYFYTSDATVAGGATPTTSDKPLDTGEDSKADDSGSGNGSGNGGGVGGRDDPGAPSGITGTIAPLQAIIDNPAAIAIAGGLALALLFLVALPTELLNSSLSSNTSRLGRVYGVVDSAMTRAQNWLIKVTHSRALVAILLVAIVSVIYGFVDPDFGFDIVSLRLVLSLAIAFFILSFVASWVSGIIIRRAWGAMAIVALQPSIILFAVIGVIVARILDFSPGFLVGVAIGLELLQASKHVSARAVFVQLAVVTGFALAAWIVYSLFTPGHDFLGLLIEDTMVATTAEGLTGALIAVFPLKFLDGRELWEVSKRLWTLAFLVVGTAFALLVLPTAIKGTDVADIGTWLIVFAVFGAVSFAVWLVFVRADQRASAVEKAKVDG